MSKEKSVCKKLQGDAKRGSMNVLAAKRWVIVGLTFLVMGSSRLYAQENTSLAWQGTGTSSWFTPTNWNPSGPPGSDQNASVTNGATAQIDAPGALAAVLTIDGGSTVQVLAGSTLGSATPVTSIVIGTTGTLQFSGGSVTVLAANGILDNGSIVFDGSSNHIQGITTTGTGNLILNGPGRSLVINSENTYTGGTTIAAGTLQIGSGATAGSITGNVVDNGVLAFDRSDAVTFTGAISGSGGLNKLAAGTLTLSGNNTYSGATTVSAGTLLAGSATGLSPNSAFTVNAVLDLNGFDSTIGSLSGTGTVLNNGATPATLTAGTDNSNTTFSGVLKDGSGIFRFAKSGTGVLTLTGTNTYTGTTTVNAGSLIVDGSIASQQTIVNPGAFLGGRGTIGGDLVNNGVVAQFNSPGTLTVVGNYTQNANGTLRIQVGGLSANQHDLVAVNGHATLAGTLQLVRVGGFNLKAGDQILFLTAKNGVSGAFDNTQNGLVATGTIVQGAIKPLADGIVLEGQQGSFADTPGIATTENGSAVARALDRVAGDPRAAALIGFLNSEPLANLPHDLALIAPTQISSVSSVGVATGKVQVSNVGQRMANIRAGSTGFSSSGFAISGGAPSFGEGFAGVTGPEGKSGPAVFAPTPDNRWGVFVTGLGEFTNVDGTANAGGYDVDTGGFTFGIDTRVTPNFVVGLTGGYAHTTVNLDGGGNIDVNGGKIGIYSTVFGNGFYLDAAASIGPSGYDLRRTALLGSANGNTDGTDINVLVAGGYDWKNGNFTIGPTASFQYSYVGLNSFTETGSLAPLKYPDQSTESERTAFGAKASYDWKIGHITVIPEISAAWQHEYGTTEYSVVTSFASGAGNNFTVKGPATGRDSLLIGAGATVIWNDRISTYLAYDGEVLRTNYQSHNVTGGFRISF